MSTRALRRRAPSGNPDHDYFIPTCDECGWTGAAYSNRTVEGRRLAERHASEHRCRPEACPKTGRSAAVCDSPDHRNCPDLNVYR